MGGMFRTTKWPLFSWKVSLLVRASASIAVQSSPPMTTWAPGCLETSRRSLLFCAGRRCGHRSLCSTKVRPQKARRTCALPESSKAVGRAGACLGLPGHTVLVFPTSTVGAFFLGVEHDGRHVRACLGAAVDRAEGCLLVGRVAAHL